MKISKSAPPSETKAKPSRHSSFKNPKKSPHYVGVDLTGDQIKIVYAKQASGKFFIQDVFYEKPEKRSDLETQQIVKDYFGKAGISSAHVFCVIPSKLFISKNVEIPSTEREEISKIIDFQAGRFTPYSRDEIVIDFLCMETEKQHYTSVLLIIVSRKLVDRCWNIFEGIGIPVRIGISSEALGITYLEMAGGVQTLGGLHIGEDSSDFTVMDKGQMVFVRSLPIGADQLRASWDMANIEFFNELNKSLAGYVDEGSGGPLQSLVVTGLVKDPDTMKNLLQASCPALTQGNISVKFMDYHTHFQSTEEALKKMVFEKGVSFFELAASLYHFQKMKIDLLPREVKLKRRFRDVSRDITALGVSLMTVFLLLSLYLGTKYYIKNSRIENLQKLSKTAFKKARDLERISTKNQVVRRILQDRGKGLYVFEIMHRMTGDDIYLSSFTYDSSGKLLIVGTAESMSRVFAFVNKLEESNYFRNVTTKETKSRNEGGRDVADFQIECLFAETF